SLWFAAIIVAFQSALLVVFPIGWGPTFFDYYEAYYAICAQSGEAGDLLGDLVTHSNPNINPMVILQPFFASSFFISLIIYMSAFVFKFLIVLREVLGRFLKTKEFNFSERIPYTQAFLLGAVIGDLFYLVFY